LGGYKLGGGWGDGLGDVRREISGKLKKTTTKKTKKDVFEKNLKKWLVQVLAWK